MRQNRDGNRRRPISLVWIGVARDVAILPRVFDCTPCRQLPLRAASCDTYYRLTGLVMHKILAVRVHI